MLARMVIGRGIVFVLENRDCSRNYSDDHGNNDEGDDKVNLDSGSKD